MSRLRANEVLNKDADGPFLATEGINVPYGKNITYNGLGDVTVLDGTSLTTTTLTADEIYLDRHQKIFFGDANELEIYNDGDNSIIKSTDETKLLNQAFYIKNFADNKFSASFNLDSSVDLRYNGISKFETTNTGVKVTGSSVSTNGWAGTSSSADVLGGLAMPFTCGFNGRISLPSVNSTMIFGGSEYSGDNHEGAVMPHAGKMVAATMYAEQAVGNLTVSAFVNGTANTSYQMSFTSPTQSNHSVIQTFYGSPLSFSAGDRLNFGVSISSLTQIQVVTVTFFVKFD